MPTNGCDGEFCSKALGVHFIWALMLHVLSCAGGGVGHAPQLGAQAIHS
jgi:hypothetical protein